MSSRVSTGSSAVGECAPVAPGQVIDDRYLVGQPIGQGGMGIVCEGTHLGLGTAVAIKLIRADFKQDVECVQRFLNEARRAAALKSERIARVHDVGQLASGEPYLVMELLEGTELQAYLEQQGPLSQADAVNIVLQICEGLAEAHESGVVHRDVKPANVFLARRRDGRLGVKLLDFGISKQFADPDPSGLTGHDESLGSPWYMSPEQMVDSSSVDHRGDIWSVGVVLYELLTGKHPFDGTSVPEICAKVLTAPTPSLRHLRADLPGELDAVVQKCLEKRPEGRYPDVLALGAALEPFARPRVGERTSVIPTQYFSAAIEELPVADIASDSGSPSAEFFRATPDPIDGFDSADSFDSTAPVVGGRTRRKFARRLRMAHWLGAAGVAAVIAVLGLAFMRGAKDPSLYSDSRVKSVATKLGGAATVASRLGTLGAPRLNDGPAAAPMTSRDDSIPLSVAITAKVWDSGPAEDTEADFSAMDPAPEAQTSTGSPSPAEINARLERYQRWVQEQGLSRIDDVSSVPAWMNDR